MGMAQQNPEVYKKLKESRYGYICPECGNIKSFRQFVRQVEIIFQDKKTGKMTETELDTLEGNEREVETVQCTECGADAKLCEKGELRA